MKTPLGQAESDLSILEVSSFQGVNVPFNLKGLGFVSFVVFQTQVS
jgi:hypothetical protein